MAQLDATADIPPIPTRTHRNITGSSSRQNSYYSRHKSLPKTPPAVGSSSKTSSVQTASPEVISTLISSLSDLSKPLPDPYDNLPGLGLSLPTSSGVGSPNDTHSATGSVGSFGVDYGAFSHSTHDAVQNQDSSVSLDELSASSPVIRTAPPPSGLTSLTAPKSPKSARSTSRDSTGLRSLIKRNSAPNSRPSSTDGSIHSKNEDTQSLGNISIERGSAVPTELKRQRSSGDSWGKKLNRNSRGLMYMSSKELLRGREVDKKRNSIGSASAAQGGRSESVHSGVRADSFLAEDPISEEPLGSFDFNMENAILDTTRRIPNRDSSLKKTGSNAKRASMRRSKRDSQGYADDAILEEARSRNKEPQRASIMLDTMYETARKSFLLDEYDTTSNTNPEAALKILESSERSSRAAPLNNGAASNQGEEEDDEDGAPFPTVTQYRKRDENSAEMEARRFSGLPSPPPEVPPKNKRNSLKIKRLSTGMAAAQERTRSPSVERSQSAVPPASVYERPDSADSIDGAVEAYICSPRLSQKIKHPQTGRVICFSEVGDTTGSTVFCCVGMGLTRYITAFYDELAATLKLRLITLDRPGVGGSEGYTDGTTTPLSWPGKHNLASVLVF